MSLCVAALGASWPLHAMLTGQDFAESEFGRRETIAREVAEGRPLLPLLGSSQTRRSLDPRVVEESVFTAASPRPSVFNMGADGLHPSAYPYALRRMFAQGRVAGVVMELGHVVQDQYGGAWTVRGVVEDDSVREAFKLCARGRRLMETADAERWAPWNVVPRLLRTIHDRRSRTAIDIASDATLRRSHGFDPVTERKDPEKLIQTLDDVYANESADIVDASPQHTFVAVARIVADLCREHRVPFAILMQPVNRELAPRVAVLRHFEETARGETIPALRAMSIPVLVPPDEFFGAENFTDHVHLQAGVAVAFSEWFAGALSQVEGFL